MEMQDLLNGRCGWCGTDSLYVKYHDEEWGRLVTDDRLLFEFLTLESAQAGLSWITILRKRERYRKAFYDSHLEYFKLADTYILFDYQNRNPLNQEARVCKVEIDKVRIK